MTYRRFPKLGLIADTSNHVILSAVPGIGPRPDVDDLPELLARTTRHSVLEQLVTDAGYDSEANHWLAREEHGVRSIIPPEMGRPGLDGKLPAGKYRRLMKQRFYWDACHQRSQVETVISMLKRNLGDRVRGVTYGSQRRELFLKALTHNIMIAYIGLFYRAPPKAIKLRLCFRTPHPPPWGGSGGLGAVNRLILMAFEPVPVSALAIEHCRPGWTFLERFSGSAEIAGSQPSPGPRQAFITTADRPVHFPEPEPRRRIHAPCGAVRLGRNVLRYSSSRLGYGRSAE